MPKLNLQRPELPIIPQLSGEQEMEAMQSGENES
jgi:hypothetical protein